MSPTRAAPTFPAGPTSQNPERNGEGIALTTPELASIGLTETKALLKGHAIDVYKSTFKPLLHTRRGAGYVLSPDSTPDGKSPEARRRDDV